MRQTKVHNLIILDESGSMSSIKSQVIHGFNQTISTIRETQQTFSDQEHNAYFYIYSMFEKWEGFSITKLWLIICKKK